MIVLGIDPGYAIVGYGVILVERGKFSVMDYGVIETHKDMSFPDRLHKISKGVEFLIKQHKPDSMAVEELFFTTNQKTAIMVAEARGVILLTAIQNEVGLFEYTPLQVKQAMTGYGKADKQQIQQMVKTMLGLAKVPKPDDAADALAVALTHAQTNRLQGLFKL